VKFAPDKPIERPAGGSARPTWLWWVLAAGVVAGFVAGYAVAVSG
jgi:hypothetical protein